MARERNNIYAIAADAVDLALDTAGTIGSVVGGLVGMGSSRSDDNENRREINDAADRMAISLKEEADAMSPEGSKSTSGRSRKSGSRKTASRRASASSSHAAGSGRSRSRSSRSASGGRKTAARKSSR